MAKILIGTSAYPNADADLMKGAGIGWVRHGFSYPFVDRIGSETTEEYLKAKAEAQAWVDKGFRIMGVTPLPGIGLRERDDAGRMPFVWHSRTPCYMGELGTDAFLSNYQEVCRFLASDLRGLVAMWQIANELDIEVFAGPLNPKQACDLVSAGARGLKVADPGLVVGTNSVAGLGKAYFLYGRLHAAYSGLLDYCGVDGYYGTWFPGGPENWRERIAELYALTGKKVLVNEWGYSSKGGLMTPEERDTSAEVCRHKKWEHAWGRGHTPEGQADFIRASFEAFAADKDKLLGVFFYRWEDQLNCWQCGAPDCPAETAWGLVGMDQTPKPGYYAFKEGVASLGGEFTP